MNQYLKNLDALLISDIANITYLIGDFDFSQTERECFVLITKNKKYIITDRRYSEAVRKQDENFHVIEEGSAFFINKSAKEFFSKNKIKKVGIEENNLTAAEYKSLKKFAKLTPADLSNLRVIKNDAEIKNIKSACMIGDLAFEYILSKIKLGVTEKEIAALLEDFIRKQEARLSFKSIIAFGKNSSVPHHFSDKTKLKKDQIVLLDFGVKVNNYCSDMTRTIFFGKADSEFRKIYQTVLNAQQNAIKSIRTGGKASETDKIARDYIMKQNFPNIIHAVGHGIGMQVHEAPTLSPNSEDIIKNGMVFSVEPGIYISNFGGVRIEDLVLVRHGRTELISKAKREIIELHV